MAAISVEDTAGKFYLAYGTALAQWADLERALGSIMLRITGMSPEIAGAVYYSAHSFNARAEMLRACVPFAKTTPAGKSFLNKLVNRASAYSTVRNTLAHNQHMTHVYGFDSDPAVREFKFKMAIRAPDGDGDLTLEAISIAAQNFAYLNQISFICLGRPKLVREPELALALLDLMPPDPVSSVVDLTKANPLAKEIERSAR